METKKIILTLGERLILVSITPQAGRYEELKMFKDFLKKIEIVAVDFEKYGIKTIENSPGVLQLVWNNEGVEAKFEYELFASEYNAIMAAMKKAEQSGSLPLALIDLYERLELHVKKE